MKATVWVVEDSKTEAALVTRALADHAVRVFERGELFLEALAAGPHPDLVVLDWELPDVTGLEICRYLRDGASTRDLPVVMVTSHRDLDDVLRGFDAGANDYIGKPFSSVELVARVRALLRHQGASGRTPAPTDVPATVLIVDDRPDSLVALEAVLAPVVDRLVRASSGEDALLSSLREPFAVIVMDVRLPAMSGIEALELLRTRAATRTTPVIFVSGEDASSSAMREAYARGGVDYLAKPVDPDVLRAKVRFFVELFRTRQAYERAAHERDEARSQSDASRGVAEGYREAMAILAHDLRTPLMALKLAISMLEHDLPEDKRRGTLDRAGRAAERMHRLVADLLDVTRGQAGGALPVNPAQVDLDVIAAEVIEEHRTAHPMRAIAWRAAEAPEGLHGLWDRDRIAQATSNLIANALQYGRADRPITVRTRADGAVATLTVHNEGAPIPTGVIERIFEPMQRGTAGGPSSSIGLGLYIVREIVRAHGGSIQVHSTAAEGTTFVITLPRSLDPQSGGPAG